MPRSATDRRIHRRSFNDYGHAHELTFSTYRRLPMLSRAGTASLFLQGLEKAREELDFSLYAYVVMPEHCHVLLSPRSENYDMAKILSAIKSPAAKAILKTHPELKPALAVTRPGRRLEHRFWQSGGGYDRNVFKTHTIWEVIRYIHLNPVRRGLCENPQDWKWSSAAAYDGSLPPIAVDLCEWFDETAKPRKDLW